MVRVRVRDWVRVRVRVGPKPLTLTLALYNLRPTAIDATVLFLCALVAHVF